MKYILYLISIVIIVCSLFAGVDIWRNYSEKSHTYGDIVISGRKINSAFEKTFDNFAGYWEPTGTVNTWQFRENFADIIEFDGTKNDYGILINNYPCLVKTVSAGLILGELNMTFYATTGEITAVTNLTVKIEFLHDKTKFTLQVTNAEIAVGYINNLVLADGFTVTVCYAETVIKGAV
jgi:hypothetical protein